MAESKTRIRVPSQYQAELRDGNRWTKPDGSNVVELIPSIINSINEN